jgi:hypothetical protein
MWIIDEARGLTLFGIPLVRHPAMVRLSRNAHTPATPDRFIGPRIPDAICEARLN